MAASGEPPAATLRVQRSPLEPSTIVLIMSGSIRRADIPALCRRAGFLLAASDAETVVCDVAALADVDAVVVDVLARLELIARRLGRRIRLRGAQPELEDLLDFVGLADVFATLSVEPERQIEERKDPPGVEEEGGRGDKTV